MATMHVDSKKSYTSYYTCIRADESVFVPCSFLFLLMNTILPTFVSYSSVVFTWYARDLSKTTVHSASCELS